VRGCGLRGPPARPRDHSVGYRWRGGSRFPGRVHVSECPEGLARKWARVIEIADLAIGWRQLPGGLPPDRQDARLVQAIEVVRALREEQALEEQAAAIALAMVPRR
jgi:hypothetical protein